MVLYCNDISNLCDLSRTGSQAHRVRENARVGMENLALVVLLVSEMEGVGLEVTGAPSPTCVVDWV